MKINILETLITLFLIYVIGGIGFMVYWSLPTPIVLEITYFNGSKEILETTYNRMCGTGKGLDEGCTECLSDARCNVMAIKIINP